MVAFAAMAGRAWWLLGVVLGGGGISSCALRTPAPRGEVLVVVDTDVTVGTTFVWKSAERT